jgi:O-antigen/teichoic acid export membrane protein
MLREANGSLLARNTLWMLGGQGVRIVLQGVYFLLIARSLGVAAYGAFIGAVSLVALVAPFASWGTGFILVKEVARDRSTFPRYWGGALCVVAISGCVLLGSVLLISHSVWGDSVPFRVLLLVGISDVIVVRVIDLTNQAFMAVEVLRKSAELYVVLSVARTIAAVCLSATAHSATASSWALLYLASAIVAALYGLVSISRSLGLPSLSLPFSRHDYSEGFYFAVSQSSQTIYNDIDKTMLVRFGGLEATGIYGAAYRIADVAFVPVAALSSATLARFFRHGRNGVAGTVRFTKKLLPYAAGYGLVAVALLFVGSSVVPELLGKDFARSAIALRWLSPLVFFKSIHYLLANSLSGSGHQSLRASIQVGIVLLNVLLNLWLIPAYSWRGAAWSSLASDGALVVCLLAGVCALSGKTTLPNDDRMVEEKVAS